MGGKRVVSVWRRGGRFFASVLTALVIAVVAAAQAPGAGPPQTAARQGVPVTLDGEVLLHIQEGLGPFTAQQRAEAAEKRIELIAGDPFYSDDLVRFERQQQGVGILYRDTLVGFVSDADAASLGLTAEESATQTIETVQRAIHSYRERRLPGERVRSVVYFVAATLFFVACLLLIRRTFRRVSTRLLGPAEPQASVQSGRALIRRIWQLESFRRRALGTARMLITLGLVAVYLQIAFWIVPLTRGFATAILDYLLDPLRTMWQGFVENAGGLFFIFVAVVLTRYLIKGLKWLFTEAAEGRVALPGVQPEWALTSFKVLRLVVIGLVAVMIYPYIPGSSTAAFQSIGLLGGAVFTLGASSSAGNFIGGLSLILSRTLHKGDRVKIGDVLGDVVEISLTVIHVRTVKNEIVSIPCGAVLSHHATNYSTVAREEGVILHTSVTIGYDVPWRRVHELLIEAALATGQIVREPAPFVLQVQLSDFYVEYELNAYTRAANSMARTYSELHQNIQDSFNRAGVEIMSPHYASLRDGNESTIPQADRKSDEPPRGFALRLDGGDRPRTA